MKTTNCFIVLACLNYSLAFAEDNFGELGRARQTVESEKGHIPGTRLYEFRAPSKISVKKVDGILKITIDNKSLESTNLFIHTNMVVGMWCEISVCEAGGQKNFKKSRYLEPSVGAFVPGLSKTNKLEFDVRPYFWRPDGDGIARPLGYSAPWISKKEGSVSTNTAYNVEMTLTLFETDSTRVGPNWAPNATEYYRLILEKTLSAKF